MGKIKWQAKLQHRFGALILHFSIGVNDISKKLLVFVIHQVTHPHHGGDISDLPHNASKTQSHGNILGILIMEFFRNSLCIDALCRKLHFRLEKRLKCLPVLQQIIVLRRDRNDTGLDFFDHAVARDHSVRSVGKNLKCLLLKPRKQPIVCPYDVIPITVPSYDAIKLSLRF